MAYNKDQWTASFEDQLLLLRPHLTARVLATISLAAWHQFGTHELDPIEVARAASAELAKPPSARGAKP